MACIDDEIVLGYLQRRLAASRTEAVERHVDRCAGCRRLVAALAGTSLLGRSATKTPPSAWASDFLPAGVAIGRYVLEARIGAGATGIVYRARDPELGRAVAIKRLRADVAGELDQRRRLLFEASALAKLSHPNVLPVYDVGEHDGHVFVAMELVDGATLRHRVVDRTRDEILELYRQAARGLVAAHEAGVCHGDFKPDNVLVTRDGRVLVADFGLLGTPAYMAPEQLATHARSAAADQFAWCVALFEALTGQRPFTGHTIAALRSAIRQSAISPAIHRLPRGLRAVLRRGLAEDPKQRWTSLAALLTALDRNRPTVRWPWIAMAATAVALLAVPTTRARPIAEDGDTPADTVVVEPMMLRPAEVAFAAGRVRDAHELAQATLVHAQTVGDETTAAAALVVRGRCEALTDTIDVALRTLGDAHASASASEDPRAAGIVVDAATETARLLAFTGEDPDDSERWLRHAEVALARHGPDEARSLALEDATAVIDTTRNDFESARRRFEHILARWAERPGVDAATVAGAKTNLGTVLMGLGRGDEAMRAHADALAQLEEAGLASHHAYGRALLGLANTENALERLEAAREHDERALAVLAAALGPRAALVGRAANNLGHVEAELGDMDAAARAFDRAEAVLREALGADHPDLAAVMVGQAGVARSRGLVVDARDRLEHAAALLERAHGLDDPSLAPILYNLGEVVRLLGDREGSRRHVGKALEVLERVHGPDHPELAGYLETVGHAAVGMGDFDEGERLLERAYAIRSQHVTDDDPSLYRYWLAIAKLHIERGEFADGDAALEHAAAAAGGRGYALSAVEQVQGESLWRQGHRKAAIALVYQARRTLGDDVGQPGMAASIDQWLAERVGKRK